MAEFQWKYRWKYKAVLIKPDYKPAFEGQVEVVSALEQGFESPLNDAGLEGWELVPVAPFATGGSLVAFLKRPEAVL
jgi:hypothetical protein